MLHQQNRDIGRDGLDDVADPAPLGGGEPGERLVEQQHPRPGGERQGHVDEALAAIGQRAGLGLLDPGKAEITHQRRRVGGNAGQGGGARPDAEAAGMTGLDGKADILLDRQPAEQIGDLERAADASGGDRLRTEAPDLAPVERHRAAIRRKHAGDEIEGSGLAGAVGADQGMQRAVHDREADAAHGANAAEALHDAIRREHRSRAAAFVNEVPGHRSDGFDAPAGHGRVGLRLLAEGGKKALGDAGQARRREHDEADEHQAEEQEPARREQREIFARQHEEQRAEGRAQEAAHAADDHHGEQLAGELDGHRVSRGEAVMEGRERAGKARQSRRDREGDELVAVSVVADEAGANLVLADRHQHAADRRVVKALQHQHDEEAENGDEAVEGPAIVEIDEAVVRPDDAAKAVLSAGQLGPAERHRVHDRGERQGQEREIDAAPAQDDEAGDSGRDRHEEKREQHGQQHLSGQGMALGEHGGIGADAEEGAVAEGDEAGMADQDVQRHGRDGEDHHVGRRGQGEADGQHEQRQHDQRRCGHEKGAQFGGHGGHSNLAMRSPNRPRGRRSRTSTIRR